MKNSIQLIGLFVLLIFASSCGEDEPQRSCIEGPRGTKTSDAINIALYTEIEDLAGLSLISADQIDVTTEGSDISDGRFYSDWQTIPTSNGNELLITEVSLHFQTSSVDPIPIALSASLAKPGDYIISITQTSNTEGDIFSVSVSSFDGVCNDTDDN